MNKGKWLFSRSGDQPLIQFMHESVYFWVGRNTHSRLVVGLYDFINVCGYAIKTDGTHMDSDYFGEFRELTTLPDGEEVGSQNQFLFMSETDRATMHRLMRTVISYRDRPLPVDFSGYWHEACILVQYLDITRPHEKRYIE